MMAPSRARALAVWRQMVGASADASAIVAADDSIKQEAVEAMMVQQHA